MSFKRLFDAYSKLLTGALIAYSVIRVQNVAPLRVRFFSSLVD